MPNFLKNQTSPYLLQHVNNPVDWYPWCEEAFERAQREDKPIFLSIGYSTCHWCHVMAHESFEDKEIAKILNQHFIAIKVDKEERPDIDSIYMSVCQAFTGSGGWPTTIFLTPQKKPFYAGTYFPKTSKYGQIGLKELLLSVHEKWQTGRGELLESANEIVSFLRRQETLEDNSHTNGASEFVGELDSEGEQLMEAAIGLYEQMFDKKYGGFGGAPKFPTPHNLLFLMSYCDKRNTKAPMEMVEKTLLQMYQGGIFDHIGGGFSRYSTDAYFLVPHFEKMLYDNALLILTYCYAYQITGKPVFVEVAKRTAAYILREMTSPEGGFYSAQDADSEGVEGKYYLLNSAEIQKVLGEKIGKEFNDYYDITPDGNFEGKSIPNLLKHGSGLWQNGAREDLDACLGVVYEYRKRRYALHLDDKILTSWNGLMIAAMCHLYRITGSQIYLNAAKRAQEFIESRLCEDNTLYVSYRKDKRSKKGYLEDYANEIFALLALYEATLEDSYLGKAKELCKKAIDGFYDDKQGGFFLYGKDNEQLILRPKETYDGAMPSGNSVMAYNLVHFYLLTGEEAFESLAKRQLAFLGRKAKEYPAGHAMFLVALSDYIDVPRKVTIVVKDKQDLIDLSCKIPLYTTIELRTEPTEHYPLKDGRTTFYVCQRHSCMPPVNELDRSVFY
ncbi:MAG: thioredoxin domain-containing protein [Lachnospiraceae bacterium]|nr:thioredoxin domain-containing protein [Lachnospiraceae bacterium]